MPTGHLPRAVELVGHHGREDLVDEGRFTGARHTGHAGEHPERECDIDVSEVVLPGTDHGDLTFRIHGSAHEWNRNRLATRQERAGDRFGIVEQPFVGSAVDYAPAVFPGAGADVDHPIRCADGVLVVFDDDQRVPEIAQPGESVDQPAVVALVQTDRRLVEHVEDTDETGADLGGEPDSLGFTTGQGGGGASESEVVEAHVEQEAEPCLHFLEDLTGDRASRGPRVRLFRKSAHAAIDSSHTSRSTSHLGLPR